MKQKRPPDYALAILCLALSVTAFSASRRGRGRPLGPQPGATARRRVSSYSFSIYNAPEVEDGRIWIITEAADDGGHREATTILLPSEY